MSDGIPSPASAGQNTIGSAVPILKGKQRTSSADLQQGIFSEIDVPDEEIEGLSEWLVQEIQLAESERQQLDLDLVKWEQQYEARPDQEKKSFPWENASNLVSPVIATAVDSIVARFLSATFGGKELWTTVPRSANWTQLADPMEHWLNWVGKEVMNMYRVCQQWYIQAAKVGTGILKLPWERRIREIRYADSKVGDVHEFVVMHDGPAPQVVPLSDFWFSSDAYSTGDIQTCEWIAHRLSLSWKALKEREASGIYQNVDRIRSDTKSQSSTMEIEQQRNVGVEITVHKDYELFEVWCSYILKNPKGASSTSAPTGSATGAPSDIQVPAELVVTIERQTGTIIRAVYNFYRHQERPFHVIRHMPRDSGILGIGIAKMLTDIQEEISTIHNHRLNNYTIANTRVFKRKRTALIGATDIYPGAFLDVDDMDDIMPMELGSEHSPLLQEELHTSAIGEKRTGVSDYTVGRESAAIGSHATATSTMALIAEGNKRFQMTIRDIREALGNIAHQAIMLYQQFAPDNQVMYEIFDAKEKVWVEKFFSLPLEYTRSNVIIDTPAISEVQNKEVAKQSYLMLMKVAQEYYQGIFQAMGIAVSPQAPQQVKEMAIEAVRTGSRIWERTLEAFDFRDANTFIPDIDAMFGLSSALDAANAPAPNSPQVNNPPGAGSMQEILNGITGQGQGGSPSPPTGPAQPPLAPTQGPIGAGAPNNNGSFGTALGGIGHGA